MSLSLCIGYFDGVRYLPDSIKNAALFNWSSKYYVPHHNDFDNVLLLLCASGWKLADTPELYFWPKAVIYSHKAWKIEAYVVPDLRAVKVVAQSHSLRYRAGLERRGREKAY